MMFINISITLIAKYITFKNKKQDELNKKTITKENFKNILLSKQDSKFIINKYIDSTMRSNIVNIFINFQINIYYSKYVLIDLPGKIYETKI